MPVPTIGAARSLLASGGVDLIRDTFTRADSASVVGSAETGQAWIQQAATWGISGNACYCSTASGVGACVIAAPRADGRLYADVKLSPTLNRAHTAILLRGIDDSNYLMLSIAKLGTGVNDVVELDKKDAGAVSALSGVNSAGLVNGQTYKTLIEMHGPTIVVKIDGVLWITYTLTGGDATKFSTPTRVGFRVNNGGATDDGQTRFDNFRLVA